MLSIERLRLQLPAAFQHRAGEIARLVAEEMAATPAGVSRRIDQLSVPTVEVSPVATDREVARSIAASVHDSLRNTTR